MRLSECLRHGHIGERRGCRRRAIRLYVERESLLKCRKAGVLGLEAGHETGHDAVNSGAW